ncbi:MAG: protein kinase, partial [Verrucomicrobia bacterium]|nr:protein kinase [Verrucomicrobiota bacterium]
MTNIDIPGFEIVEKVGAGGMATVWKARQLSLNRDVAIKILFSKFASDPADILRFQNEAQAAARLKHPGIVQVYDANAQGGLYYFIMEYVAGYTVAEWIKRKGRLSIKDALLVTHCVVDALQYAWNAAGIIHCDVKPDNILVDSDGTVKVSDLGLARTLSHLIVETAPDEIMGTPAYISPEQAMGEAEINYRADIYSLGATLYHMVTGIVPFGDYTADEILELQVSGHLPDPCDVNPEIPQQVAWLIEKMMCKDPAGRQDSWEAVRQDIERVRKARRPVGEVLPEGVSTVLRSVNRARAAMPGVNLLRTAPASPVAVAVRRAVLVGCVLGAYLIFNAARQGTLNNWLSPFGIQIGSPQTQEAPEPLDLVVDVAWDDDYAKAMTWIAANPTRYDEGMAMLMRVVEGASGTEYAEKALARVGALRSEKEKQMTAALARLAQFAAPLADAGRFDEAIALYADYAGEWRVETEVERARQVDEFRRMAHDAIPKPMRPMEAVLDDVAGAVYRGQRAQAMRALDEAVKDPGLAEQRADLESLRAELAGAYAADQRILDSFVRQKGEQLTIQLRSGPRALKVRDVRNGRVVAAVGDVSGDLGAQGTIEFDVQFLKYPERFKR